MSNTVFAQAERTENKLQSELAEHSVAVPAKKSAFEDLLASIDREEAEECGIEEGATISSRDQANWYARKYLELQADITDKETTAKDYLEATKKRVEHWLEKSTSGSRSSAEYIKSLLEAFASRELEGAARKSLKLVDGTLSFKKQQDEYEYDEEKIRVFLLDTDGGGDYLVAQPAKVDKAKLKKEGTVKDGHLFINDVEIKGIKVTPREDKFSVS